MFLGHIAVGLAGKRAAPSVSLATWMTAVQLVDMIWPIFLLLGLEHVRIAPGVTAFTPLDFYDYPLTHSLIAALAWAAVFAGGWYLARRDRRVALLLAGGVVSHWLLDFISHRPDMPILTRGPYVGLELWRSIPATLVVEGLMFTIAVLLYVRGGFPGARRLSFWLLIAFLVIAYFGAAFGPPPPDVRTLAITGLAGWLFIPWVWFADRARRTASRA